MNTPYRFEFPADTLWPTQTASHLCIDLPQPIPAAVQTLLLTLSIEHAANPTHRPSGFVFCIRFTNANKSAGYCGSVHVEWQGENTLIWPVCGLTPFGTDVPGWEAITTLVLDTEEPSRGDIIHVQAVGWSEHVLPRPINAYEDALETFFVNSMWDPRDWRITSNLPEVRRQVVSTWFWGDLRLHHPHAGDWVAIERAYPGGVAVSDYSDLFALISFDNNAVCEIDLKLDGDWHTKVSSRQGILNFDEAEAALAGAQRLDAVRLRMVCTQAVDAVLTGIFSWIILQRIGADPLAIRRDGAHDAAMPIARQTPAPLTTDGLETGLFISRGDLMDLQAKARHGIGAELWKRLQAAAEDHLNYDPEPHIGTFLPIRRGESLTRRFVEAAPSWETMMPELALAYLVSEDERYARHLKRMVLAACRCAHWGTAFIDRFPVGIWGYRAPFWPSHMATTVACAADAISNWWSEDERAFIDQSLLEKGLFWAREYVDRLDYCRWMNQGVIFATGGILAGLAVEKRHPEIRPEIEHLIAYLLEVLDNYLDADGATGEGPAYWNYTLSMAVRALGPIARREGKTVAELLPAKFAASIEYPLNLRSAAGDGTILINIGDAGYSNRILSPLLLFFAHHFQRPDVMQVWLDQYGHADAYPDDAWSFLFFDPAIAPQPLQMPLTKHFRGSDRVFWRSGWTRGSTLCMFESGNWGPDHYHMDKHQILIDAFGERMLVDRGMCDYSNPLSMHLFNTASHNTLTIDDKNQADVRKGPAAKLEALEDTGLYRYIRSEASAAYPDLDLFRRELMFVRSRYFILADTLLGVRGRATWHFHTPLIPEAVPGGLYLRGKQGSLLMKVLQPMQSTQWTWRETREQLDIDANADMLFQRVGLLKHKPAPEIRPNQLSDHHIMLEMPDQPADMRLIVALIPIEAGKEDQISVIAQDQTITITDHTTNICDHITLPGLAVARADDVLPAWVQLQND